jgi:hypothetical protein
MSVAVVLLQKVSLLVAVERCPARLGLTATVHAHAHGHARVRGPLSMLALGHGRERELSRWIEVLTSVEAARGEGWRQRQAER